MVEKDTYSYKGWLVSDSIIKRSFAVLGHHLIAGLIIYAVVLAFVLVFVAIFGFTALLALA